MDRTLFRKVLIANRGEIACRVAQALQELGMRAAAVYSDADAAALHVTRADEAYHLEGVTSAETYLRGDRIIELAKAHGVDAIHPGYGFLSENAGFAEACRAAGIVFIGPTPEVMRAVGDKIIAKQTAQAAGVPVVPGWSGSLEAGIGPLREAAGTIGYPVLIKAAAGGGGRGMRVVPREADLESAVEQAAREAKSAFGDGRVFLEKYVANPRHIEFQIFGDTKGQVVHLFERECSIQRRHQKVLEESPSPALTAELRQQMGEAAVRLAKKIGYTNAGTVEFMLDPAGNFYFLEVNARLQVEHPVTELVTLQDLVHAQVRVAAGQPLPFTQESLRQTGHAVECRICAEDPRNNFLPSTGRIIRCIPPAGANVRVDSGVVEGSDVSVHYDPMLAKLITFGRTREDALDRMRWALSHYVILGVTTNIEFLLRLIDHAEFRAGRLHTHFLAEQDVMGTEPGAPPDEALALAAWAACHAGNGRAARGPAGRGVGSTGQAEDSPWRTAGAWRVT